MGFTMTSSAAFDYHDIRVDIYDPGMTLIGGVTRLVSLSSKIREFEGGECEVVLDLADPLCSIQYSGSSAFAREFSGYRVRVWYRDNEFFDGVCVVMEDEDAEESGSGSDDIPVNVRLTCVSWVDWFLSGRLVMGSDGNRYAPSAGKADNVLKAVWRANFATGGVSPAQYASGVSDPITSSSFVVSRANVGNGWTFSVAADTTTHPTTVTHRWDHGRDLAAESREFARRYGLGISGSWSGTTFTITTSYPATGTDRTATVKFDRERGGLSYFKRITDRLSQSNVCETRGQKRRTTQVRKYAGNTTSYNDVGLRETGEVWRSANNQDATNNSDYIITQEAGALTTYEARIREVDGSCFGDFVLSDKVTIFDSLRGITVQDWVTGLQLDFQSPGPPELQITLGREPISVDRQLSRSGGGGGGSGRGGGAAKNADGESDVDPDDIKSYAYILAQSSSTDAESHSHYLELKGADTSNVLRARTAATDSANSDASGTPDVVTIEVIADFTEGTLVPTYYFKVKDAGGTVYRVPAVPEVAPWP